MCKETKKLLFCMTNNISIKNYPLWTLQFYTDCNYCKVEAFSNLLYCDQGRRNRGARGAIAPLPFNILKTRGQKGQIVLFKISITDTFFLVKLYN